MANQKFLTNVNGTLAEAQAVSTSAGSGSAGQIPALGSDGRLNLNMMPPGIGPEADIITCSENLAASDLVNIYTNAGLANVRKADASTGGKEANGFVLSSYTSGQNATVYRPSQSNTQVTGLTPGATYFLSDVTPGAITATAPTASGHVVQIVGKAIDAITLDFNPGTPITLV